MTDLSQGLTADFFTAAGASDADAQALATQHNAMSGRLGVEARAGMAASLENLPPPAKPPVPASMSNAEAQAALQAHTESQLSAHLEQAFGPPASQYDYRLPESDTTLNEEEMAADGELLAAFHAEQLPTFVVNTISQSLVESARLQARETPQAAAARISSNHASLHRLWGDSYEKNLGVVDTLLGQMGERSPQMRAFVAAAAPHLDPLSTDLLLQYATHRAARG